MASENVKTGDSAVTTIVNLAEEAKLAREGVVKAPNYALASICKSLVAGGVAGGVSVPIGSLAISENHSECWGFGIRSRTAVAPLERLKILLQVQNPHNIKYNGTIQGLKYIWRTEGLRGLFKGNGTNCARIVPNSAVKFFSYEQASKGILYMYQQQTGNEDAQLTPVLRLGAGACAGIIAMSATYPMDMVRGRITVQTEASPYQYRGMFHALSTVLREEGPRALYKGWLPSVIGVIPYVGLNFAVYESLKDWLVKSNAFGLADNSELGVTTRLACGAAAGTVGQTVAYPLDVIRRRMQMVGWNHAASVLTGDGRVKVPLEYTGMIDAFRKTVQHEGFGALYKGLVPNSVKVVPSIALAFVTYEMVKDILGVEIRISD
ncbi:Mitochondrial adenine nucleotide transporter ADNT1 Adenine nucleotide transporter [Vigna angularis]|uniref:Mitochondrial adenine nucleotide transporter ADNT1 Adenine nucleotide transporter n=1 Tax=Phaseolus angularis TaxID=3914 RepID=A0A8T0JPQ7_PHAAN|nr:Mitochondrial adenine nucleotide transporter ADNT1 Adenine nucleotide transporter [Vigna angularis]